MTLLKAVGLVGALSLGMLGHASEARACGGCFVPPDENSQVTGHRMVMSIGMDHSTLYDQIEYSGSPESFAWVLPTKGEVEVGVSSDLLFNQLGADSAVTVVAPPRECPYFNCGYDETAGFGEGSSGSGSGASNDGGVQIIAQKVVGPYETVQLAATDPKALETWLSDHGYKLPTDIQPLVASYVVEGFNFLAVKLVPGEGVQSMQPIRITTKGSNVTLPLRMVAAGTGALTTITLYVVSEFRAEPANFPGFVIDPQSVVWNYDQERSNYTDLRAAGYVASKGAGWLTESSREYSALGFRSQIQNVIGFAGAGQSGYGDDYEAATLAADEDLDVLFAGMDENSVWLTRLRAELPRSALNADIQLQAAKAQTSVSNFIQTTSYVGAQPACPPAPPGCDDPTTTDDDVIVSGGSGCSVGTSRVGGVAFGGVVAVAGLAMFVRRRRNAQR